MVIIAINQKIKKGRLQIEKRYKINTYSNCQLRARCVFTMAESGYILDGISTDTVVFRLGSWIQIFLRKKSTAVHQRLPATQEKTESLVSLSIVIGQGKIDIVRW